MSASSTPSIFGISEVFLAVFLASLWTVMLASGFSTRAELFPSEIALLYIVVCVISFNVSTLGRLSIEDFFCRP
jgi:hypothetical protein